MRTLASDEHPVLERSLLHLIDSEAVPCRIRRVELIRRSTRSSVVVVGPLEGECRCAGFGLQALGSALPRTLGVVFSELGIRARGTLPCSWSYGVARAVSEFADEQLLVATGPPSRLALRDRLDGLHVLVPDQSAAAAWKALGALSTRVVAPGALPDRAPVERGARPETLRVGIFCDGVATEEAALLMLHRFGVVALTEQPYFACLNRRSPHVGPMMRYATHVGIDSSFELLEESSFPGEIDVAMVSVEDAARSSEQVLDLAARGVVSLAYTDRVPIDESLSLADHGLLECPAGITNSGSVQLLSLYEDPDLLHRARECALATGRARSAGAWQSDFGQAVGELFSRC